jgi:phospho-N-acetylmuramoyl-pentapeptide-transferase
MLYYLHHLSGYWPVLNVTRYITFRTAAASITALVIGLLVGPWMIQKLRDFQIGQVIRQEGPATHRTKAGTPTMGGLLILTSVLVPTLLWADLATPFVWIAVLATAGFGAIGFADDYLKIVRRSHHGLLPRYKMLWQTVVGLMAAWRCWCSRAAISTTPVDLPFFKRLIRISRICICRRRPSFSWIDEHGQPDGRTRWPRDQRVCRVAAAFTALSYVDPCRVRELPSADQAAARSGGADDLLRRARRREPRVPLVQLLSR